MGTPKSSIYLFKVYRIYFSTWEIPLALLIDKVEILYSLPLRHLFHCLYNSQNSEKVVKIHLKKNYLGSSRRAAVVNESD